MQTVLAAFNSSVIVGSVMLVLGVIFSQKIKDFLSGVPSHVRAALNEAEAKVKQDLSTAGAEVLARLPKLPRVTSGPAVVPPGPPAPSA